MRGVLWNEAGLPLRRHRPCPVCDETRELSSAFDEVRCAMCGWHGKLSDMHTPSVYPNMITRLKNAT